jgi:putative CocE/NonD family hydrolase
MVSAVQLHVETDVVVPLRDGCTISCDVFRPAQGGPFPVLVHTPYMGRRSWTGFAIVLNPLTAVERGYAVVLGDVRGSGRSEGLRTIIHGQAEDGYDTVEWAAAQPWSSGQVGVFGSSGMGISALQTALAAPPHLRAAMVLFTGANYFHGMRYTSGVFELSSQAQARAEALNRLARTPDLGQHASLREQVTALGDDPWAHARQLPLLDDSVLPASLSPVYYEWLRHRTYDDYWASVDAVARVDSIRVPILQVTGWYDMYARGQLDLERALRSHPVEEVRQQSRLVVGPWAHDTYVEIQATRAGERDFGASADASWATLTPLALDWFDGVLGAGPAPQAPPVRYFEMGANRWREHERWPPDSKPLELFLHSGGRANGRFGDGTLSTVHPESEPVDCYSYDPFDPVPTTGGPTMSRVLGIRQGVVDQSTVEERDDVLIYTTALLIEPLRIVDRPRLVLHAVTSAVDTDFTAKLVDLDPNGYCANIAEGIVRARHRDGVDQETLVTPGERLELEVELNDVAHTFLPGHRIRLEISSSNFPRFARNLNCATHPHEAGRAEAVVAVQQISHTRDAASRLVLGTIE